MSLSDAKARLSELGRRVSEQHERITVTRNGEAQFVLVSADDLEGLEITLEVLSDEGAVGRITESLAGLESGDPGATVAELRADLARRRAGA
jgi:prevent-host-death family protein